MDVEVAFVLVLVGSLLLAMAARRWWPVVVPLIACPLLYLGLAEGWWGFGLGDGWQYAAVAITLFGVVSAAAGVVLGRGLVEMWRRR